MAGKERFKAILLQGWRIEGYSWATIERATKKNAASFRKRRFILVVTRKGNLVLGRPGSDLLSQGLSHSTIGAEEFNGRVRDGIGFKLLARTTRPAKDKDTKQARMRSIRAQSSGLTQGPTPNAKHWSCA